MRKTRDVSRAVISALLSLAMIAHNPNIGAVTDEFKRSTLSHELGHALGLGHPNETYDYFGGASVMSTSGHVLYTPQQHDLDDLKSKYM